MTASEAGTDFALVASRLVHGSISRSPGMSGRRLAEPVDTATAWRATRSVTVPSSAVTRTRLTPVNSAWPRTRSMPVFWSHRTCDASSQLCVITSRRRSTPVTSRSPVTACFAPSRSRAARRAAALRSSPLDGMQAQYEHSPPTSSASTMTVVIPPCTVRSATFSPTAPAPITMTSYSRSLIPSRYPLPRARDRHAGENTCCGAGARVHRMPSSDKGLVVRRPSRRTGTNRFLDPPPGSRHEELR